MVEITPMVEIKLWAPLASRADAHLVGGASGDAPARVVEMRRHGTGADPEYEQQYDQRFSGNE